MASFTEQIAGFAQMTKERQEQVMRGTALSIFGKIVARTPVGNPDLWKSKPPKGYRGGTLRGNWQISIGRPEIGIVDIGHDPQPSSVLLGYRADQTIYISNNLPYAKRVEEGWSSQAPAGMVAVTLAEFNRIVRESIS